MNLLNSRNSYGKISGLDSNNEEDIRLYNLIYRKYMLNEDKMDEYLNIHG